MAITIRGSKTETLSLRLDPKTRFALEFVARIKGQSITMVVERGILDLANSTYIGDFNLNWTDFWEISEGSRTLRIISEASYPSSYEEEELLHFCKAHWEFFFSSKEANKPIEHNVDILWQNISYYRDIWAKEKIDNYWAAGEAMVKALERAGLKAPTWPRKSSDKPRRESFAADLDDEIPF